MPSPFDAIRTGIAAGFKGKMYPLKLVKKNQSKVSQKDARGDPVPINSKAHDAEGFRDEYSAFFKKTAGLPMATAKVCIFGGLLPAGVVPEQHDSVLLQGVWYTLGECKTDPVQALWECPGTVTSAPKGF